MKRQNKECEDSGVYYIKYAPGDIVVRDDGRRYYCVGVFHEPSVVLEEISKDRIPTYKKAELGTRVQFALGSQMDERFTKYLKTARLVQANE
jgi:hypothetical protein